MMHSYSYTQTTIHNTSNPSPLNTIQHRDHPLAAYVFVWRKYKPYNTEMLCIDLVVDKPPYAVMFRMVVAENMNSEGETCHSLPWFNHKFHKWLYYDSALLHPFGLNRCASNTIENTQRIVTIIECWNIPWILCTILWWWSRRSVCASWGTPCPLLWDDPCSPNNPSSMPKVCNA